MFVQRNFGHLAELRVSIGRARARVSYLHQSAKRSATASARRKRSATKPAYNVNNRLWRATCTRKTLLYSRLPRVQRALGGRFGVLTCEREPDNASDRYAVAVSTLEHAHVRIFDISYRKYFVLLNIRSLKYFAILIFVALCDYENISTAKISRFTVITFPTPLVSRRLHRGGLGVHKNPPFLSYA